MRRLNGQQYIPNVGGHIPEDKDQALVQTPFGDGLVIRTRKNVGTKGPIVREIELQSWLKHTPIAQSAKMRKPPMLYSVQNYPSVPVEVGSEVMCAFGRGKVIEIRTQQHEIQCHNTNNDDEDNSKNHNNDNKVPTKTIVVRISSWRLAGRSTVKCYLQESAVCMLRPKKLYDMTVPERVERAAELKDLAAQHFAKKEYESALSTYALGVDAVRYVQHANDSNNALRADLLTVMITCSNNAATCCTKLSLWNEAMKHARAAESLIVALLEKVDNGGRSKIYDVLKEDGYTDVKLFGEWRAKSLLVMATCANEKGNTDECIEYTKKGREIVEKYNKIATEQILDLATVKHNSTKVDDCIKSLKSSMKALELCDKELIKLLRISKEKKKKIFEKEKLRAQAMFGGGNAAASTSGISSSSSSTSNHKTSSNDNHPTTPSVIPSNSERNNSNSLRDDGLSNSESINHESVQHPPQPTTTSIPNLKTVASSSSSSKKKVTFSEKIGSHFVDRIATNDNKKSSSKKSSSKLRQKRADENDKNFEAGIGLGLLLVGVVIGVTAIHLMGKGTRVITK